MSAIQAIEGLFIPFTDTEVTCINCGRKAPISAVWGADPTPPDDFYSIWWSVCDYDCMGSVTLTGGVDEIASMHSVLLLDTQ